MDCEITFKLKPKSIEVIEHLAEIFEIDKEQVLECLLYPFAIEVLDLPGPPGVSFKDYQTYCQFIRDTLSWRKQGEKKNWEKKKKDGYI